MTEIILLGNMVLIMVCWYHIGWARANLHYGKIGIDPMFKEWKQQLDDMEKGTKNDIDWAKLFDMLIQAYLSTENSPWAIRKVEGYFKKRKLKKIEVKHGTK